MSMTFRASNLLSVFEDKADFGLGFFFYLVPNKRLKTSHYSSRFIDFIVNK